MRPRFRLGSWKAWTLVCVLLLAGACKAKALALDGAPPGEPAPPPALPAGAARVVGLSGQVSLLRHRELWAVQLNDVISPGEEIVAGPDGHATLECEDGSRLEIFPNSRVVFRANHGNWRDLLDVFLGKVKIHVQKFGGRPNSYRVNSPTALIAVRGTVFEVTVESSEATVVSVVEGVVGVSHRMLPGKEVLLKGGETLRVLASEPLASQTPSKMQILGRVLDVALDRAVAVARTAGGAGGRTPVPGAPVPGATPAPGGTGPGTGAGQAPPPGGRPGGIPEGDTGPGVSNPPPTGGSAPKPAPQPPSREPRSPRAGPSSF